MKLHLVYLGVDGTQINLKEMENFLFQAISNLKASKFRGGL